MALVDLYFAEATFVDSRNRQSTVRARVTAANGQGYINQLTQILKDGTPVGQLMLSWEEFNAGALVHKGVSLETWDDALVLPDPDGGIFNFDKVRVAYKSGLNSYGFTIPARDTTAYNVASDGVSIIIEGAGAAADTIDLVDRVNATVLGDNGVAAVVTGITIVS